MNKCMAVNQYYALNSNCIAYAIFHVNNALRTVVMLQKCSSMQIDQKIHCTYINTAQITLLTFTIRDQCAGQEMELKWF